jgi:hypothetical protein
MSCCPRQLMKDQSIAPSLVRLPFLPSPSSGSRAGRPIEPGSNTGATGFDVTQSRLPSTFDMTYDTRAPQLREVRKDESLSGQGISSVAQSSSTLPFASSENWGTSRSEVYDRASAADIERALGLVGTELLPTLLPTDSVN